MTKTTTRPDHRSADQELASRLPEYGTEAIGNLTDQDLMTLLVTVTNEVRARPDAGTNPVVASYEFEDRKGGRWLVRTYLNGVVDGASLEGVGLTPGFEQRFRGAPETRKVERFINSEEMIGA